MSGLEHCAYLTFVVKSLKEACDKKPDVAERLVDGGWGWFSILISCRWQWKISMSLSTRGNHIVYMCAVVR